jgi:hypothetical protein
MQLFGKAPLLLRLFKGWIYLVRSTVSYRTIGRGKQLQGQVNSIEMRKPEDTSLRNSVGLRALISVAYEMARERVIWLLFCLIYS